MVLGKSSPRASAKRFVCCVPYAPRLRDVEVQCALDRDPVRRREEIVHQDQQVAFQLEIEVEERGDDGTTNHHRH